MHVRGLLVEDHNGQDFLLSTESRTGMRRHQLVALQRINGQWKPVKGPEESACRELLIGAFVDFFVDICRVLNSSGADRIVAIAPMSGRSRPRRTFHLKARRPCN
ncbi:hypothetical protein [Candidatus Nitrospira nitrificans]|uniref:Uncharacterized protein n=1 Tax=Candidatus Nitrospira nitrificans TaxID=1742973 RepID=A0A0S4LGZ2_9BACT|nr:hypothetical protein [Candidatus Nitrospira nitrificans]CUS35268.1 hypothetical protein COMA2_20177 [Candidatus Nitrospira nitrificans]